MRQGVEVHKLDEQGDLVWSYRGQLLQAQPELRVLEAYFDRERFSLGLFDLSPGSRMVEYFYRDRWYNIFEIYDREERLQGWYCNIARPAEFKPQLIRQQDLALDLIVDTQGEMELQDQQEFEQLSIPDEDRAQALAGLEELKAKVKERRHPFDAISHPQEKSAPSS